MTTRRKILCALLVIVLALFCVAAVACGPDTPEVPEVPPKTEWPEAGVYYFDAVNDECTLTLNVGDTFSLYVKGEHQSGSYTLTDKTLELDFNKEGMANVTATYEGNVVTLTYNGSAMRMLRKVNYTVSFHTNGGSTVDAQTVLNGKAAAQPADPTREGFLFVGWYADEQFKTPYTFGNQPVTADTVVYAQWSAVNTEGVEYTVTLDGNYDGAEANVAVNTIGGKLFDLPVLEREGYSFGGWWFSADNDGEKLSYKYENGMTLTGNTTLYALWQENATGDKLAAPIVNVSAGTITWNSVDGARSYLVRVLAEDGTVIVDETTAATIYNIAFAELAAGKYEVRVTALANSGDAANAESVRYYTNKALDKVSGFMVIEPSTLVYNTVAGAEKYLITVVCGNPEHKHVAFDNGTSRTFNFANCAMTENGISFKVTAVGEGFASSVSETFTYKRELASVNGLRFDEATQILSWNQVANAEGYMVSVTCGNAAHNHGFVNFGTQTFVSLKECDPCEGGIVVKVYPKTNGYLSPEAVEYVYNKATLATPADLAINGETLTWGVVENATGYEVMVDGKTYTVTENSFDLATILDVVEGVSYKISVRATGDAASLWSDELTARYLELDALVTYANGKITWSPVIGADYYEVQVNDGEIVKVEGGAFTANVTLTVAGNNTVKVRFVDGVGRSTWASTTVFAHRVTFDTLGGSPIADQFKAVGDAITLPAADKIGYSFVDWYNVPGGATSNGMVYADELFNESGSIVLYAYYKANKYGITYNYGTGGNGTLTSDSVFFEQNFTLTVPTPSDVAGAFGGWFSAPYGMGVQYTDEKGNSLVPWSHLEDKELYAFWIDATLDFTLTKVNGKDVYAVGKGDKIHLVSEITIPATFKGLPVAFIVGNGFKDCANLKVVNLPTTIEQISGIAPFAGCTSLEAVNVYEVDGVADSQFASVDGVLFEKDENGNLAKLALMPLAKTGTYRIPSGITEIPAEAFKGASVSKVIVPASVMVIGREAFDGCLKLTSVVFEVTEAGVTEVPLAIGVRAFRGCTALERIALPARLTDIKLQRYSVYEGEIYTDDAENAFLGCYNLTTIHVAANNKLYKSVNGVLFSKDGKTLVLAPESLEGAYVIPEGTQAIAPGAFIGCTKLEEITLPGTLTLVGECAFYGNTGMQTLKLAGNAFSDMTIDKHAFHGCSKLASVVFDETSRLAVIGDYAFEGAAFTSFTFPATLTKVGVGAFKSCASLEVISFAEGGKTLEFGEDAFKSCSSLTTVFIPANVSKMPGAFTGCGSLEAVEVAENSPYFTTHEGVLYDIDMTEIVFFPRGKSGEYTIPDTVTSIANGTFRSMNGITKLSIPASVTYIGAEAFYWAQFTTIEFYGEADTELVIGERAFEHVYCDTITLPANTVTIGKYAFWYAQVDEIILNEGLRTIEEHAFEYTRANITVPASVETIGAHAFEGNANNSYSVDFPNVTLTVENSQLKVIGAHAFEGNPYCVNVVIPASVETIGDYAFYNCENIETLTFAPDSQLKTIGGYAFSCSSRYYAAPFDTVTIPKSVTAIGARAFYNTNLKTVIFEDGGTEDLVLGTTVAIEGYYGVEYMTGEVFGYTYDLETVVLPARLTELRYQTFYSAGYYAYDGLSITIEGEPRLTTIGDGCFKSANITGFHIPASVRNLDPVVDPVSGQTYDRPGIGNEAFDSYHITSITFEMGGDQPLTIGAGAFYSVKFTSLVLPARLAPYTSYTGEVIPALADGAYVFESCSNLESITVEDKAGALFASIDGVLVTADMTEIICYPAARAGSFEVPATVTKIGARAFYRAEVLTALTFVGGTEPMTIGNSAFAYCEALTEILLPDNVVSLGDTVFYGCYALESLTLPASLTDFTGSMVTDCDSLAEINVGADGKGDYYSSVNGVLYNADKTALVMYPAAKTDTELTLDANVKTIFADAFAGNPTLTKIILPEGLIEIQSRAFSGCSALVEVNIPSTVQLIGGNAFENCYSLTTLTIATEGNDPLIISDYAFASCRALTAVAFPARLFSIGDCAFYAGYNKVSNLAEITFAEGCQLVSIGAQAFEGASLVNVAIPAGVVTIGNRAFFGNTSLVTFTAGEGLISIGDNAFAGCSELTMVNFPASLKTLGASIFYLYDWGDSYTCPKLETVTFASGSQLEYIPAGTFAYTALESFEVPASVKGMGDGEYYSTRNPGVFDHVTTLESISFERGSLCANIGVAAFYSCSSLVNVEIAPSVSTIGDYAFASCTALEAITVPETAVNLGASIFTNCSALAEVELETKATVLPSDMFYNCESLSNVVIPATVTTISNGCFEGTAISAFQVDAASTYFKVVDGVLYNTDVTEIVAFPPAMSAMTSFTVPNTVTKIGNGLFKGMEQLTTVTFEGGRTADLIIGDEAFSGCYSLVNIELPEGTTEIGEEAFYDCTALYLFTIPSTVKTIGDDAFRYCESIIEVCNKSTVAISSSYGNLGYYAWNLYTPDDGQSYLTVTDDGYIFFDDTELCVYYGVVTLVKYVGPGGEITLPEGVEAIHDYAFLDRTDLTTMIIPAGTGTDEDYNNIGIADYAFYGCDNLTVFCEDEWFDWYWYYGDCFDYVKTTYYGYTGREYRLRLDLDGVWDTSFKDESYEQILYSTREFTLPTPEREGYIFGGWYQNAYLTGNALKGTTYYWGQNMSLYAKWYTPEEWAALSAGDSLENPYATVSGETKTVKVEEGGNKFYFVVTVEAGETWNITTGGSGDHMLWFYDADGYQIKTYDSGYAENYNYTFSEAGTYYIAVGYYSSYSTGEFTATLTQK